MNWGQFEGTLGYFGYTFGTTLEEVWGLFEGTLGILKVAPSGHFWGALGLSLGVLWDYFDGILGVVWGHYEGP